MVSTDDKNSLLGGSASVRDRNVAKNERRFNGGRKVPLVEHRPEDTLRRAAFLAFRSDPKGSEGRCDRWTGGGIGIRVPFRAVWP